MKFLPLSLALLACGAGTTLLADPSNKKTIVKFSAPFQLPAAHGASGVISMPPGTYVFRLLDSSSNRNIVQVTDERGTKVYTTILAMNDYRLNASSKTVMYFSERQSGAPMAVKSWFYPGDNFGQRFVYPKAQAVQVAAAVKEPVPSHEVPVVEKIVERTQYVAVPVYIQTPEKQQVAYNSSAFEKADATDAAGEDGAAVPAPQAPSTVAAAPARALPATASPVPFFAMLGTLFLTVGILLRRTASQLR